jgi:hypothetical protein
VLGFFRRISLAGKWLQGIIPAKNRAEAYRLPEITGLPNEIWPSGGGHFFSAPLAFGAKAGPFLLT